MSKINKTDIELMKQTGSIKLFKWELFWHYSVVLFLFLGPIFLVWDFIQYYQGTYDGVRSPHERVWITIPFGIMAIIFYFIQRNRLKFKTYAIKATADQFKEAFEKTATELEWSVEQQDRGFIRAHRSWNWTTSWGELITIVREKDQVLINSICDPNAIFISVVSGGWNKRNVKTFIKNLEEIKESGRVLD